MTLTLTLLVASSNAPLYEDPGRAQTPLGGARPLVSPLSLAGEPKSDLATAVLTFTDVPARCTRAGAGSHPGVPNPWVPNPLGDYLPRYPAPWVPREAGTYLRGVGYLGS